MKPLFLVLVLLATVVPLHAAASASPNAIAVLNREAQWLAAVSRGDAKTLGTILADNYVHTTSAGTVEYREGAIANVGKLAAFLQTTSDQTVDFAGNVAVVHGILTTRSNRDWMSMAAVSRARYTDVYVKDASGWKVLSAQETPIPYKR